VRKKNQSEEIINENPFAIAERSGSLERIKNRMRDHIKNPNNSAKESLIYFGLHLILDKTVMIKR